MPTFIKSVMAGVDIEDATDMLTPYAQCLVYKDLCEFIESGKEFDLWEIVDRRAAVLDDRYLGRKFDDAVKFLPVVLQTKEITDEDGNVFTVTNVSKCGLED